MRRRVVNIVEKFYLCVLMSVKFWWVLIRNFIVYGLAAAINSIVLYYISPEENRDLHQKLKDDNKSDLKYSGLVSIIASFLISCWIACLVVIARTHSKNIILSVLFWIMAAWSIAMLTYLVELGIVKSTEEYSEAKYYYIRAFVYFIRVPQITSIVALLWIIMSVFVVKNAVIAIFIMPGLVAATAGKVYRLLLEKKEAENS